MSDKQLAQLAAECGVFSEFMDMQGITRVAGPDTQRALLRAAGIAAENAADVRDSLAQLHAHRAAALAPQDVVIRSKKPQRVKVARAVHFTVCAEADGKILAEGKGDTCINLPALPDGVHSLLLADDQGRQDVTLIVTPERAPMITDVCGHSPIWGVTAALYGLVTEAGKTLGDYGDLADLAETVAHAGADFLGINPVHALGISAAETISPYSPVHRGFFNVDHIALVEDATSTDNSHLLDYRYHRQKHRTGLRAAFVAFMANGCAGERAEFDAFCARNRAELARFCRFEALSERYGADWRIWPADAETHPTAPDETAFHQWMQWQCDLQLAQAQSAAKSSGLGLGLYLDLAVGARRGGAESWGADAPMARGVSLGAPPDHLSPAGQNWQLSAFSPCKLRTSKYESFRFLLRQSMRHAGLLRIDHALGLNRSYWIPDDGSPGGYIAQPFQSLAALIALEAARAGCVIVGEDLGLVPDGFRSDMSAAGFYGYSVMQYERNTRGALKPASDLRGQSLACFGTHDTPTLAGFWSGRDVSWWEKLDWISAQDAAQARDTRAADRSRLVDDQSAAPPTERTGATVRDLVHARLAAAPSEMVAVQLDDILEVEDAQNLPGTVTEHPNWKRRYPCTIAQLAQSDALRATGGIMASAGRSNAQKKDKT